MQSNRKNKKTISNNYFFVKYENAYLLMNIDTKIVELAVLTSH